MKYCSVICAFACWAFSANAESISGNGLAEICEDDLEVSQMLCSGLILGISEGLPFGAFLVLHYREGLSIEDAGLEASPAMKICEPEGVTNSQKIAVVKKFLSGNPELRHQSARALAWLSWVDAFPCE